MLLVGVTCGFTLSCKIECGIELESNLIFCCCRLEIAGGVSFLDLACEISEIDSFIALHCNLRLICFLTGGLRFRLYIKLQATKKLLIEATTNFSS